MTRICCIKFVSTPDSSKNLVKWSEMSLDLEVRSNCENWLLLRDDVLTDKDTVYWIKRTVISIGTMLIVLLLPLLWLAKQIYIDDIEVSDFSTMS